MSDDLRHNINLVIPGLNFWGDQNDAAKSVVDKTKWVMETAINRIEKLEEQAHYANGVADLAMKHRDYAEQRVEKLEAALIALKAMHHEGGIDDIQERDDRTYFMVCDALEQLNAPEKLI